MVRVRCLRVVRGCSGALVKALVDGFRLGMGYRDPICLFLVDFEAKLIVRVKVKKVGFSRKDGRVIVVEEGGHFAQSPC